MQSYVLCHLRDDVLRRDLAASTTRVHEAIAAHLAYIAEFDARRLYAPAGYHCMHAYCVRELLLTTDTAAKRIQAARTARKFPLLFPALADGGLSLSVVCLLAPHLTEENFAELVERATHRSKQDVREFLAARFGFVARPEFVRALPEVSLKSLHAPGHVKTSTPLLDNLAMSASDLTSDPLKSPEGAGQEDMQHDSGDKSSEPSSVAEAQSVTVSKRYLVQFTLSEEAHAKLRYAQALLSHAVPKGELAEVFERALDALIPVLERRKFGNRVVNRSEAAARRPSRSSRHIPAHVKRAVWKRDQRQCTFVSANGTRCNARRFLEFDHIQPVARGGTATVDGVRLRCRAHNQYEAERIFGAGFMSAKRESARSSSEGSARAIAPEGPRGRRGP